MKGVTLKVKMAGTVRRSVALPRQLIEEVVALAPPELKDNLNRLVVESLREFVFHRKQEKFHRAMEEMAADPAIRSASERITKEFLRAEKDGLRP